MRRKTNHQQARADLAKVSPDVLHAFSMRLPAGLLIEVHRWAEGKGLDLASAIRELTALGLSRNAERITQFSFGEHHHG